MLTILSRFCCPSRFKPAPFLSSTCPSFPSFSFEFAVPPLFPCPLTSKNLLFPLYTPHKKKVQYMYKLEMHNFKSHVCSLGLTRVLCTTTRLIQGATLTSPVSALESGKTAESRWPLTRNCGMRARSLTFCRVSGRISKGTGCISSLASLPVWDTMTEHQT